MKSWAPVNNDRNRAIAADARTRREFAFRSGLTAGAADIFYRGDVVVPERDWQFRMEVMDNEPAQKITVDTRAVTCKPRN